MQFSFRLFAVAACLQVSAFAGDTGQTSQRLDVEIKVEMDYLLYLPKDYDNQESWPLVLFLHGAGERGDDIELVKKHGSMNGCWRKSACRRADELAFRLLFQLGIHFGIISTFGSKNVSSSDHLGHSSGNMPDPHS
jgi:hypothetical protein